MLQGPGRSNRAAHGRSGGEPDRDIAWRAGESFRRLADCDRIRPIFPTTALHWLVSAHYLQTFQSPGRETNRPARSIQKSPRERSEELRLGKGGVSPGKYRWAPDQ